MFLASRPHYSCHHHRDTRFSSGILPFENRLLCCKGLPGLLLWWHPRLWRLNQIPSNHPLFFLIVYLGACCFLTECMYQRVKPYNFRIDICICLGGLTERFMVCVCLFWFFFFLLLTFFLKCGLCVHISAKALQKLETLHIYAALLILKHSVTGGYQSICLPETAHQCFCCYAPHYIH